MRQRYKPSLSLKGISLKQKGRHIVYIWLRGQETLYVGMSGNGLERLLGGSHHILGRAEPIQDDDIIEIYECINLESAAKKERHFIQMRNPKYNGNKERMTNKKQLERVLNIDDLINARVRNL